jgi:signal transduction histidine kinase
MNASYVSGPNRVHTYGVLLTQGVLAASTVCQTVRKRPACGFADVLGQREGAPARGILLETMVLFDDLDVVVLAEHGSYPAHNGEQDIHADAHVRPDDIVPECYSVCQRSLHPEKAFLIAASGDGRYAISAERVAAKFLPRMEMIPGELSLAFKNLLHNAVKYSYRTVPQGNKRYVDVCLSTTNGKYYDVSICNYGVGIQFDEIANELIWKAGYRGKLSKDRNRTGSGLGLAHVRLAVEDIHGGSIAVRSTEQAGGAWLTVFAVRLPIRQKDKLQRKEKGQYEWYR